MEQNKFYQIKNITEHEYTLVGCDGSVITRPIQDVDRLASSFTIQDAKDGDVLCYKDEISLYKHDIKNCTKQETTFGGFVYHCCYDGKRFIMDSLYSLTEQDKIDIHPATKEQRDILFQKMKETGYEWDAENKELKKIEQVNVNWHREDEQNLNACLGYISDDSLCRWLKDVIHVKYDKPAWSEEDENILKAITYTVVRNSFYKECMGISNEKMIDWLKSLKDRLQHQWKPKGIHLEALRCVINGNNLDVIALKDLFEQLKKL